MCVYVCACVGVNVCVGEYLCARVIFVVFPTVLAENKSGKMYVILVRKLFS